VDSILVNQYGVNFYNFGVNHPCRALSHLLLSKTLEYKKPKYVFFDVLAMTHKKTHSVYPIVEREEHLRQYAGDNRTIVTDYLKSTAYTINFVTRSFKNDKLDLSYVSEKYGYRGDNIGSPEEIASQLDKVLHPEKYRGKFTAVIRDLSSKIFGDKFIDNGKLWMKDLKFVDNSDFQRLMLRESISLLKENNIPYFFVYYPVHPGRGKNQELLAEFIVKNKDILSDNPSEIILTISNEKFLNYHKLWSDLQHLNGKGAAIFTSDIFEQFIQKSSSSGE
jgi:hypothetical protein